MWYTHYGPKIKEQTDDHCSESTVDLYNKLLDVIPSYDENYNLSELRQRHMESEDVSEELENHFDSMFHEYACGNDNSPSLSASFTKTERKRYDPAVLLAYIHEAMITKTDPQWDYDNKTVLDLINALLNKDEESAITALKNYIHEEDIDLKPHDANKLIRVFNNTVDLSAILFLRN